MTIAGTAGLADAEYFTDPYGQGWRRQAHMESETACPTFQNAWLEWMPFDCSTTCIFSSADL